MDGRLAAPGARLALPAAALVAAALLLALPACGPSYEPTEPLGRGTIRYDPALIEVGGDPIQHEPNYLLVGVNVDGALTHVDPIYWSDRVGSNPRPRELFQEFELVYRTLLSHRGVVEAEAALASFRTWTRRQPWPASSSGSPAFDPTAMGGTGGTSGTSGGSEPPDGLGRPGTLEPFFLHYWSLGS